MVSRLLTFFSEETAERAADAVIMNDVDDDYHQKIACFFLGLHIVENNRKIHSCYYNDTSLGCSNRMKYRICEYLCQLYQ